MKRMGVPSQHHKIVLNFLCEIFLKDLFENFEKRQISKTESQ